MLFEEPAPRLSGDKFWSAGSPGRSPGCAKKKEKRKKKRRKGKKEGKGEEG
jgi:hypothetical protein